MMENNIYVQEAQEPKGSLVGGVIGALLGAAIGAVAWAVVGVLGYIASIVGFVIAFLADKGYDLFKGRQGTVKMIVLIVCVVLAVAAGTVGSWVWYIHDDYTEQYNALTEAEKKFGDIMTEAEYMQELLTDSEVQGEMLKDGALGLVFGIGGAIGLISAARKGKQQPAAESPAPEDTAA